MFDVMFSDLNINFFRMFNNKKRNVVYCHLSVCVFFSSDAHHIFSKKEIEQIG